MRTSHFLNILNLTNNEYFLLRPSSRPLIVDKDVVEAIGNLNSAPQNIIETLREEGVLTNLNPEEEIALFYNFLEESNIQIGKTPGKRRGE